MQLYILLDTSGSMEGAKIGALNDAMSNILVTLQEAAFDGGHIKLAVMTIGKTAQWMYESPKSVMEFGWKELQANGMTPLGLACEKLNDALKQYAVAGESIGIILLSDGCPTDDYDSGVSLLEQDGIYSFADKYAIALGENADVPSLKRFVKDDTHLFFVNTVDNLLDTLSNTIKKEINVSTKPSNIEITGSDDEWD